MEKLNYQGFENCLKLTNGTIEIVVSNGFGPRILAYNFVGGENVFGIHAAAKSQTALGEFKPYGGHRLWIAPENMPNSYAPDNEPIEYFYDQNNNSIRLVQPFEKVSKTQKEITVTLDSEGSGVNVNHKITNLGDQKMLSAAWALTIMRDGGEVLIPNEPFAAYAAETLLPVRNLTVWSYTDLSDSRWRFDSQYIRLKVDENKLNPQKIGVLNRQGWISYQLSDAVFTKKFNYFDRAIYPDLNSNTEIYTAGSFIEIETLSPLQTINPQSSVEHTEVWSLQKV